MLALSDDPEVSRAHARLVLREGAWWLEDVGSRNGTFVDEFASAYRLEEPVRLTAGQIFRVGLTRWRLEVGQAEEMEQIATAEGALDG